jgi:oligopeptide/dipeptide ABC transporter ATP-binding protein
LSATLATVQSPALPLLDVQHLSVEFVRGTGGALRAVRDVSFAVGPGEVVGLVGESGSGKTVTSLAIMGLLRYPAVVTGGAVLFDGDDLRRLPPRALRQRRGRDLAMIFQNPATSLNPVFTIGRQLVETVRAHEDCSQAEARRRAIEMLGLVGIPDPARRLRQYPHQFSGGMCQRIMIAMALCTHPRLLIADEPTTALDVTTQAQVLDLLRTINQQLGTSVLLITHNFGVVAELCHRTLVMYAGEIVERAPTAQLFANPLHPYTRALLRCVPDLESDDPLQPLEGTPPDLSRLQQGCPFVTRCASRRQDCADVAPTLVEVESDHGARCLLYGGGRDVSGAPGQIGV